MKNLTVLYLVSIMIISCQKIETNSPAFQANIDMIFLKQVFEANYIENGDYFVYKEKIVIK